MTPYLPRQHDPLIMMKYVLLFIALLLPLSAAEPLRVFIRAGEKTHRPGAHDYPRFMTEWIKLLNKRGASATGALAFPTSEQIQATDVVVFYAHNAGNMTPTQRQLLDTFQRRGGGLVFIHAAVCGDDAQWFKKITGGAWEHKYSKFFEGNFAINYKDREHPITQGVGDFSLDDEIYWNLHMVPEAKILACTDCKKAPGSPQMWSLEKEKSRTFTAIPGHWHTTFSIPQYRAILLRGIAWSGHREVDSLVIPTEIEALKKPENGPKMNRVTGLPVVENAR
jgi:type 1 glutamine amidotransferase